MEKEDSPQREAEVTLSIKALEEEFLQISELSEMEKSYSSEVIGLLKQIIEPLNATFHVKPGSISRTDSSIREVLLTPQGILCIMRDSGNMSSRPLEALPSEILVKVLIEVIPDVKRLLVEKRQKISTRVTTLEKVLREFRKIPGGTAQAGNSGSTASSRAGVGPQMNTGARKLTKDRNAGQDALKSALDTEK